MDDLLAQIDDVKARWMTGSPTESACPALWRDALGEAPNTTLLALTGQFTRLATAPSSGTLTARAPLPRLNLPTLPEDHRPMFRRVLTDKTIGAVPLLFFLAARGVTAHPADWMPSASTEAPDVYGPWIDWVADDASNTDNDTLTADNWDDWLPHARYLAFVQLRKDAPDTARTLLAEKSGDVPAEQRLKLVRALHATLSENDVEVLEKLASDRSGKVQTQANNMLARLGRMKADAEAVAEFAEFYEKQKAGILSRKQIITARKLKTNAQKKRRWELANALPLSAFAQAFDLAPDALIDTYDLESAPEEVVAMTAATGTAEQASKLMTRISEAKGLDDLDLQSLTERLDPNHRKNTALQLVARDNTRFQRTYDALNPTLGTLPIDPLLKAPAFSTLMKHLQKDDNRVQSSVAEALTHLGLIANAEAADRLLRHFTSAGGLMAADPRLALLRLNTALKET